MLDGGGMDMYVPSKDDEPSRSARSSGERSLGKLPVLSKAPLSRGGGARPLSCSRAIMMRDECLLCFVRGSDWKEMAPAC